jgi:hypothetical protein
VEDIVATNARGEWLTRTSEEAREYWESLSEADQEKPFTVLCSDGWYAAPQRVPVGEDSALMCDPVSVIAGAVGGLIVGKKLAPKPSAPAPAPEPLAPAPEPAVAQADAAKQVEADKAAAAAQATDRANQLLRAERLRRRAQRSLLGSFDTAGQAAAPAAVSGAQVAPVSVLGGSSMYDGTKRIPRAPYAQMSP